MSDDNVVDIWRAKSAGDLSKHSVQQYSEQCDEDYLRRIRERGVCKANRINNKHSGPPAHAGHCRYCNVWVHKDIHGNWLRDISYI